MNFFRFRLVNTVLFFLIGILLGFILKERFHPVLKPAPAEHSQPDYTAESATATVQSSPQTFLPAAAPKKSKKVYSKPAPASFPVHEAKAAPILIADQSQFFKKPAVYAGRELEMTLQMITAKRASGGWRLNFVYMGTQKKLYYLSVEDTGTLGEKPDLRIGYYYRVKFICKTGDAVDGNILSSVNFTGEKADWATGLSAIE